MKFKKGDRVVATEDYGPVKKGMLGIFVAYNSFGSPGVDFDKLTEGHGLGGFDVPSPRKPGHGYWTQYIKLIRRQKQRKPAKRTGNKRSTKRVKNSR